MKSEERSGQARKNTEADELVVRVLGGFADVLKCLVEGACEMPGDGLYTRLSWSK